jgi:phage tail-like protein
MRDPSDDNFLFLNRDGRWPGFHWHGLERREDGALVLATVPRRATPPSEAVASAPAPCAPAGIAADGRGSLYFSDPDGSRVMRIDGCDRTVASVPCLGRGTSDPSALRSPRGLLVPPTRPSLLVADGGNHRIQVFDLERWQLVDVWGQASVGGMPRPGSRPGELHTPWAIAGDTRGNVYVVDWGNRRVQQFNAVGDVVASFWTNMHAAGVLERPSDAAVLERPNGAWILVIDAARSAVFVFDTDGNPVRDPGGRPRAIHGLSRPMGIAAAGDSVYVGDNDARRILHFRIDDAIELVGATVAWSGPIAALALDARGTLWAHAGGALVPIPLDARGGHATTGWLWSDPIEVQARPVAWHRLQAIAAAHGPGAHLQLYAHTSNDAAAAPAFDPTAAVPLADLGWKSVTSPDVDVHDLYIGGADARYLRIGAVFSGDGTTTPVVSQLRVEFDHTGYDAYLPAIYRPRGADDDFIVRLLSLFETFFAGVEEEIASLPALFDPQAAPRRFLAWLAGCLGLDLDDTWDEPTQRRVIAQAFELSARRGTTSGLRDSLRAFAGVEAVIEEPLLNAAWWALPSDAAACCASCTASPERDEANSILGATTMLAPAQPQGAVLGTAVLDQSHLLDDADFGTPLFDDVAHQFSVQVFRSQVMCPDVLPRLRAVLDREKPAHTTYHLCIIEPRFRVGYQSRVGIDAVVGGSPRSLALGTDQTLGRDTMLAGPPPSLLGMGSRLGLTARLG